MHATTPPPLCPSYNFLCIAYNLFREIFVTEIIVQKEDDYANPTATRYTFGGKHLRRRSEQYLGVIAEAVGKVWLVYSHSICRDRELIAFY